MPLLPEDLARVELALCRKPPGVAAESMCVS
jgi:hypothetical protein